MISGEKEDIEQQTSKLEISSRAVEAPLVGIPIIGGQPQIPLKIGNQEPMSCDAQLNEIPIFLDRNGQPDFSRNMTSFSIIHAESFEQVQ